jgi:hypothetical protein
MHRYGIQPHNIKTISAVRFNTRWKVQFGTEVIPDTDKAIEAIRHNNPDVKVFMDGSGMDRKIGVAAVLYRSGRPKTKLRHQLGPQRHHTVYKGEGIGALLGIKLIANQWNIRSAFIYIDNRATITAHTRSPRKIWVQRSYPVRTARGGASRLSLVEQAYDV